MENERIARLEEQGRWTKEKLESIESKVDSLLEFKWRSLGVIVFVGFLTSVIIEVARAMGHI